eukprot:CAMPEP_0197072422 /NCGR_PEP_ID=MMETSP1384-20130603/210090_1 /TAXON_ID=29189 /ORGANISM="Ammonia sp." /LENGTH=240 /DNA_ID=CAMNT_0042511239 /DNA_START=80 /DNA_END=802 /DNA_ORIENTATION=-
MFALLFLTLASFITCREVNAGLFGKKVRDSPGPIRASYDASTPAVIASDAGTLPFSSFSADQWKQVLDAKGMKIALGDLQSIQEAVKHAIVGEYGQYTTYVQPDSVNGYVFGAWKVQVYVNKAVKHVIVGEYGQYTTYVQPDSVNGYVFGAWKVQVYVNKIKDVWKYRMVQGEKRVVCIQRVYRKVTRKYGLFKTAKNKDYDQNVACTPQVVGGLVNNIVDDIEASWKQTYPLAINHTEL